MIMIMGGIGDGHGQIERKYPVRSLYFASIMRGTKLSA